MWSALKKLPVPSKVIAHVGYSPSFVVRCTQVWMGQRWKSAHSKSTVQLFFPGNTPPTLHTQFKKANVKNIMHLACKLSACSWRPHLAKPPGYEREMVKRKKSTTKNHTLAISSPTEVQQADTANSTVLPVGTFSFKRNNSGRMQMFPHIPGRECGNVHVSLAQKQKQDNQSTRWTGSLHKATRQCRPRVCNVLPKHLRAALSGAMCAS